MKYQSPFERERTRFFAVSSAGVLAISILFLGSKEAALLGAAILLFSPPPVRREIRRTLIRILLYLRPG